MQNAKDTFYAMLQGRLAAINPARTIVVRGLVRPGTLVDENELPTAALATDVFHLRWTGLQVDRTSSLPLAAMECSILYATDGTSGNGGMDRGRLLAAMDAELASALGAAPHSTVKSNYAAAGVGVAPHRDGDGHLLGRSGLRRCWGRWRAPSAHSLVPGLCVRRSR